MSSWIGLFCQFFKKKSSKKHLKSQIGIVIDEKILINPKLHWDDYIF